LKCGKIYGRKTEKHLEKIVDGLARAFAELVGLADCDIDYFLAHPVCKRNPVYQR
jgi:hypothetical protein